MSPTANGPGVGHQDGTQCGPGRRADRAPTNTAANSRLSKPNNGNPSSARGSSSDHHPGVSMVCARAELAAWWLIPVPVSRPCPKTSSICLTSSPRTTRWNPIRRMSISKSHRNVGAPRVCAGRCVQRSPHPGDHPGDRRVPRLAGNYRSPTSGGTPMDCRSRPGYRHLRSWRRIPLSRWLIQPTATPTPAESCDPVAQPRPHHRLGRRNRRHPSHNPPGTVGSNTTRRMAVRPTPTRPVRSPSAQTRFCVTVSGT